METNRAMYQDLESILYTREELAEAVKKLGRRITEDYQGKKHKKPHKGKQKCPEIEENNAPEEIEE